MFFHEIYLSEKQPSSLEEGAGQGFDREELPPPMSDDSMPDPAARQRRLERIAFAIPRFICGALVLAIVAVSGANVVARYVFLSPFFWAEEVQRYILICFVYFGAILVTWDGRHLKMDILSQFIRSPWKEVMNFVATVTFIGICALVVTQSWHVTLLQVEFDKHSVAAEIPMVVPHSMVLIGFFFMLIAVVVRFRANIRGEMGRGHDDPDKKRDEIHIDHGV